MDQTGQLIEPSPVQFSFGAPGWNVLGILILLLLVTAAWLAIRYYRKNRYRRVALQRLDEIAIRCQQNQDYSAWVYESNNLIKRVAISRYGRQNVAGLRAAEWTGYLNKTWRQKSFDKADAQMLDKDLYAPMPGINAGQAAAFAEKAGQWLKKHKYALRAGV